MKMILLLKKKNYGELSAQGQYDSFKTQTETLSKYAI